MGSSQSIPSTSEITDAPINVSNVKEYTASTKNGPKTKSMDQTNPISVTIEEESIADSDSSIVSTESDYLSEEEEEDEFLAERRVILEEARQLREVAGFYHYPEAPVASHFAAGSRCFFSRYSAPTSNPNDLEVEAERKLILTDAKNLKELAYWYLHPENPVVSSDATASARNYFTRPSAPEQEDEDIEEERERILEEMKLLKITAEWYMHPEKPVTVDSTACGHNFFARPSAPEYKDDMDERDLILEEMKELKTIAEWYMHPEKPVSVDATACGRNYFSRPSAFDDNAGCVSWEDSLKEQHLSLDFESNYTEEMEEERKRVLAEAKQLKEVASWYLQPEKPIAVDSTVFGRNYFSRLSAPEQEDVDDIEERELILAEVNELKMVADWYRNPEKEVTVYATACGRNFFNRPSAPIEDEGDAEEREEILADAAELLRVAKWYMYPEKPVTVYATASGRNFFSRPSAPPVDVEMEEERLRILADAKQLKEVAGWYANPNQPVKSDGFATGRNYFTRPSAPEYEDDTEERDQVLAEAKELKEVASWYSNPEQPVKSDGFATARSYFSRPSAPEQEDDVEEREQIFAEAEELKEVAIWYLQPEKPVVSSSVNCVRNYFDRPSATGHADHIHSEGYANDSGIHSDYVHQGFDFQYAEYDHHDHDHHQHHDCDVSQQSFHSHGDHFDMDEDLSGFRDSINAFRDSVVGTHDPQHIPIIKEEDDGKEGNLSRSPSSIMLFDEQHAV
jgi:hypothetical protein